MALRRTGEWDRVANLVRNLGPEMVKARNLALRRWGLKAEGLAKGHISHQDLAWAPLKPKTVARKVRKGFSENILVESSTYFQSITSWVEEDQVLVGVNRTKREPDGALLMDIAALHEYGSMSGNVPARPLWEPTMQEVMRWHIASNDPRRIFLQNIQRYL